MRRLPTLNQTDEYWERTTGRVKGARPRLDNFVRTAPIAGILPAHPYDTEEPVMSQPVTLRALLGDYPVTRALRRGDVTSPAVRLQFADVTSPAAAFKRVVRDLEFDVAELALVTFLLARAHGKPLVLLPAVVLGRFQHPYLVYNQERGPLTPTDLIGRRVGIRSYSVTTGTWLRGILAEDWGVDLGGITWVTLEEPHVAEFRDPPNVRRAASGQDLLEMLLAGDIDAAIVSGREPTDPRVVPLIPDPTAAARAWYEKHQAIHVNHLVTVTAALSRSQPHAVTEVYRLLKASKRAAGPPAAGALDPTPFGVEANRRNLEVAIDCVYRQRLIPRRFTVDELFDDVTRGLDAT
jgi:4,5-dihydroxyphthalate decarboxylase